MENLRGTSKLENGDWVRQWFNSEERDLENEKDKGFISGRADVFLFFWFIPNILTLFFGTLIFSFIGKALVGFVISLLGGLLGSWIATFIFKIKKKKRSQGLDEEFYQDKEYGTLRKRAKVLIPALRDFEYHRSCYNQLYNLMERGTVERNPEEMDRYASFIKYADEVLASAVKNFSAVREYTDREVRYRKDKSQQGTSEESSLVLLLEAIGDTTTHHDLGTLLKPLTTLQNEEALLEVINDLKTPPIQTQVSA